MGSNYEDPYIWWASTFRYMDYKRDDPELQGDVTIAAGEFIRRFLLHVLPPGFHRIQHYGLLPGSARRASLALARRLLKAAPKPANDNTDEPADYRPPCPCCGEHMVIVEIFERWSQPRAPPARITVVRDLAPRPCMVCIYSIPDHRLTGSRYVRDHRRPGRITLRWGAEALRRSGKTAAGTETGTADKVLSDQTRSDIGWLG